MSRSLLDSTRTAFRSLQLSGAARFRPRFRRPRWMEPTDGLQGLFDARAERLLREGQVVWGAIIVANTRLFEPGANDHPGKLLWSPDPAFDSMPDRLRELAEALADLKDTKTVPSRLQELTTYAKDDDSRAARLLVPPSLARGRVVYAGTTLFPRAFLSRGRLGWPVLPTLTHRDIDWALPLPVAFWVEELRVAYEDLSATLPA